MRRVNAWLVFLVIWWVIFFAFVLALASKASTILIPYAYLPIISRAGSLLANGDFEDGGWAQTPALRWRWPSQQAEEVFVQEISSPVGWQAWFEEYRPCSGHLSGQPETRQTTLGPRVYSGLSAYQFFTFWRCNVGGLMQRAELPAGSYVLCGQVHAWFSRCSERPYDRPYDEDCKTEINWAHALARVGVDPTGQADYWDAPTLWWSDSVEWYGIYGEVCLSFDLEARGVVSVWLRGETTHALKHNDWYWDHIVTRRIR